MSNINEISAGILSGDTQLVGFELDGALKKYRAVDVPIVVAAANLYESLWVKFTAAEIIAGTEKTLAAAPGDDKFIVPVYVFAVYQYLGTVFSSSSNGLVIGPGRTGTPFYTLDWETVLKQAENALMIKNVTYEGTHPSAGEWENKAFTGYTSGDAADGDGWVKVKLVYSIVSF